MADEKKSEEDDKDGAAGQGSKKLLIFGLIGGLIVGGAATFAITTMFFSNPGAVVEEVEPEPEVEPPPEITAIYIQVGRLPASLLDGRGRLLGYMFLDLSLELANTGDRDWLLSRMPLVRDAFIRSISADGIMQPGSLTQLDHDGLPKRLRDAANKALKRDIITGILVTNALRTER